MKKINFILLAALSLSLVGCQSTPIEKPVENDRKACTRDYRPVCGEVEVECVTTPCDPVQTTFPNKCEAENAKAKVLHEGKCKEEKINPKEGCLSFDGNWAEDHRECTGISKTQCEKIGGNFNECASACRHNPAAKICTMQCLFICEF